MLDYEEDVEDESQQDERSRQEEIVAFALFDGEPDNPYGEPETGEQDELEPEMDIAGEKNFIKAAAGETGLETDTVEVEKHYPVSIYSSVLANVMGKPYESIRQNIEAEINELYGKNYLIEHTKIILSSQMSKDGICRDELDALVDKVYAEPIIPTSACDLDLAQYVLPQCKNKLCLTKPNGQWHWWNGQIWENDSNNLELEATIQRLIVNVPNYFHDPKEKIAANKTVRSSGTVGRVLQSLRREIRAVASSVFDANPYILNCENGIIELTKEMKFRPAAPNDYVTRMAKVRYDSTAQCPKFIKFLNEVMCQNQDNFRLIRAMMGYMLLGGANEERLMFWLLGCGRNGKSTFIRILMALMGSYGTSILMSTLMTGQKSGPRDDLMSLVACRLLTVNEFDDTDKLEARTAKSLTGNDFMKARFLYGGFTDILIGGLPVVSTNSMPMLSDNSSEAIWDRFRIIPFDRRFAKEEVNPKMYPELIEELPGILNFALDGLSDYLRDRQTLVSETPAMVECKNQYRISSNPISSFINLYYERVDPKAGKTSSKDIFEDYNKWAIQNKISEPISYPKLRDQMRSLGIQENATKGRFYCCVRKNQQGTPNGFDTDIKEAI